MGCGGVVCDLLPVVEVVANKVEVSVGVDGGLGEVGEGPAAHERLVGGVGGREDAGQLGERLGGSVCREGRASACHGDECEQGMCAHR